MRYSAGCQECLKSDLAHTVTKSQPLCTTYTKLNLRDRVLGKAEKNSFIVCQTRGSQWANALKSVCPDLEWVVRSFIVVVKEGIGYSSDW